MNDWHVWHMCPTWLSADEWEREIYDRIDHYATYFFMPIHRQGQLWGCKIQSTRNSVDWGRFVFSDEFRFQLCPDDTVRCLETSRAAWGSCPYYRMPYIPTVVCYVLGCFDSRTPLEVISVTLEAQLYIGDILRRVLLPVSVTRYGFCLSEKKILWNPWLTFQQDNVRPHTVCVSTHCL